ncbi:MAG: hypothetical protein ACK5B9_06970 [Flavobacteriia bacterium]|jgi:hypothetical protein
MEDIHNNYVQEFLKQGTTKMNQFGYLIKPEIINGPDGLTSINLIARLDDSLKYIIQFAYNRLDYNLGVIVYEIASKNLNSKIMVLPKAINSDSDIYGYMGTNMPREVERLLDDICDKLINTSNSSLPKAGLKWWQKLFGSE